VLVVNDDHGVRRLAGQILQANGYRVAEARGAAGALALLELGILADLLVIDPVRRPDGDEIIEQFRIARPRLQVASVDKVLNGWFRAPRADANAVWAAA